MPQRCPSRCTSERQRVYERESALIERRADDRTFDPEFDQTHQGLKIGQFGDAAGGDNRSLGLGAHAPQEIQVGAGQHAVLVDIGDDVSGTTLRVEAGEHFEQITAVTGPATGGQRPTTHVEPDGNAVAVLRDRSRTPGRLFEGRSADVDPSTTGSHRRSQRLVVPDPTAHLDVDVEDPDDLRLEFAVMPATEGRIQIDQMDPFGAGLLPAQGGLDRITELLLRSGDALDELDGLAIGDVDSRKEFQVPPGRHIRLYRHLHQFLTRGIRPSCAAARHLRRRTSPGGTA